MNNILLVDDEPMNRIYISTLLTKHLNSHDIPFTLHQAEHWERAIDFARKHNYSVVIMDYGMPGMNWWEAIEKLKKELKWDWIGIWYTAYDRGYTTYNMVNVWQHFLDAWAKKVYLKHTQMDDMFGFISQELIKKVRGNA